MFDGREPVGGTVVKGLALALSMSMIACIGGGNGDDSSVRAFYPTVKVGMSLVDVVIAGEKAQAYDIKYWVLARNCSRTGQGCAKPQQAAERVYLGGARADPS